MNILIVKLSAIGDVIHTLPALNAIRKHYPDAHITWLVEQAAGDLIKAHGALDRMIVSKRKRWIKDLKKLSVLNTFRELYCFIKELTDTHYDIIIDFQGLLKSGILVGLAKGKRKIGFDRGMERMEHSQIFLNERVPPVNMDNHALLRNMMLLDAIGIPSRGVEYNLSISDPEYGQVDDLLTQHGVMGSKPLVPINPGAKWPTKLWDSRKFAILADRLIEWLNVEVIFTGSAEDRAIIKNIEDGMKHTATNLGGETTLRMLAGLYAKSSLVISTDTGPMHIAAAVDTPVVAILGPTAPWRTGPFGDGHQIIRADLACSPCFKRKCDTVDCMDEISVEDVWDGVQRIVDG